MAYALQNSDVVRVTILTAAGNQVAMNTMHYVCTGKVGAGADSDIAASQYSSAIAPLYKAVQDTDTLFAGVILQKIWPLPVIRQSQSATGRGAGSLSPPVLPLQVSGLIKFQTGLAGRKYRGRLFIPFPAEVDSSLPTSGIPEPIPGYVTRIQAIGTFVTATFVAGTGGNTTQLVPTIYHRKDNSATAIETAVAEQVWATQRKRGALGRPNTLPF